MEPVTCWVCVRLGVKGGGMPRGAAKTFGMVAGYISSLTFQMG